MSSIRWLGTAVSLAACVGLAACSADQPINASFPLTVDQAKTELRVMEAIPRPLERPVVVLTGFMDPGLGSAYMSCRLRELTGDPRVIGVGWLGDFDFDACRRDTIAKVEKRFPSSDPQWTTEVDVVGISMGGVVARYAELPPRQGEPPRKRLKIARLYSVSAPHQGAALATLPTFDANQIALRKGSSMIASLEEHWPYADYEIYPYVRLDDRVVGPQNAAPRGDTAWWVQNEPGQLAHVLALTDPRILADIARRLRGEPPFSTLPRSPLPPS